GVEVAITNTATNISRRTTTNDLGFFRFAAVEPGDYSVTFNLTGFDTFRIDQITVNTAQEVTVNQTLTLSRVAAEISVTEVPGIDLAKTSATIERTFPGRLVEDFPLTTDRRDVTRLSLLAPNVTRAPASNQFSANGQRARNNNFMLDGIDNNDFTVT